MQEIETAKISVCNFHCYKIQTDVFRCFLKRDPENSPKKQLQLSFFSKATDLL